MYKKLKSQSLEFEIRIGKKDKDEVQTAVDEIKTLEINEQISDGLENGTYEIIKNRLKKHGNDLKDRLDKLNCARKSVFGSIETALLGSERIITENNCIPRDMAPVGFSFIFGYNVHMGLKSKIELQDVFSIYEYRERSFQKISLDLIQDAQFQNDFNELYKYYKNTFFAKFTIIEPYLYMIFQTGKSATDIKAFKWLIEEGRLTYIDNRSDHEIRFQNKQELSWVRIRREDHREGMHPHVSIMDKVFVETIGGDLTIKVEDNTDTGKGIYSEVVEDKDQTLDDAEILYSAIGHLILLKIRPYKEKDYRYFIFNQKLQNVVRIDAIKDACMLLPDNHGLIFPKGCYLQSGEYKIYDVPSEDFVFEQRIDASNGEDYQYLFYNKENGIYLIYSYNLIEQALETPIICSGYSHFRNGEMLVFKHEDEPRKNHMLQIWQTPYVGKNHVTQTKNESILFNIGNKEIVRCMADCKVVYNLIQKGESYANIYVDIVKETDRIADSYFWLCKEEAFNIKATLANIREASASAVAEFEKVTRIKRSTEKQINHVEEKAQKLLKEIEYGNFCSIGEYVKVLSNLRLLRGEIVSLKELRYTNLPLIDSLEANVKEKSEMFSKKCVEFLLQPEGLKPYLDCVKGQQGNISTITKTSSGKELADDMAKTSTDLELLIDIVSNFKIEDPTKTTEIIENISSIFSLLNQGKAALKTRMDELVRGEGTAQFHSQMKLLSQAIVNYLDISDSIEKCDEYLTKVMVQIEELEGKFTDFEEFILKLSEKREEIYNAFEAKKQTLLEKKNKKQSALFSASERIINGIANRLKNFNTVNEINGYFATDIMIEKVREIVDQLIALGDTVKADEIQARLKTIKENAVRQLKDKQELFVEGKNLIKLGKHCFSINTQGLDLTMVQKSDNLYFHISGTDFWDKVIWDRMYEFRHLWHQEVVSENREVYRSEYLAYKIFEASCKNEHESLEVLCEYSDEKLLEYIRRFMEPRYQECYIKGVHDLDCCKLLKALMYLHKNISLLVYSPKARAMAQLFWHHYAGAPVKEMLSTRLKELSKVALYFNAKPDIEDYLTDVKVQMEQAFLSTSFLDKKHIPEASEYLCRELMGGNAFVISLDAEEVYKKFTQELKAKKANTHFAESLKAVEKDLEGTFYLLRQWLSAFFEDEGLSNGADAIDEVIAMLMLNSYDSKQVIQTKTELKVTELCGNHPTIKKGEYILSYTKFVEKLRTFDRTVVPAYNEFQSLKKDLMQKFKDELRLEEFKPAVLSSFVRNKLIDKVYLPLIGANLAKQIGVAGEEKRTDLMGVLLLLSPPGYGKTTLVEYVASRLGITLIKINGPAIGNEVTSLDPARAESASAKEELRKLNLAFKMGNNVMIYIDDIQHCNPEFLQKFISLCDGQRKIEGVYKGVGQTFDLRGKKVAVVMAGNPYTESGERFQIPDMLANRADVYNLGDMLRENEEAFMLSYVENSLTSNPVLNALANKSQKDIYTLIEIAQGCGRDGLDFEGNYSAEEVNEFVAVIEKLLKVRDIVLKVNMQYIHSAAQADEYRKEPSFKLQGSYRNMNKIAEKIVPVMNEQELNNLILNAYENDAQTLTKDAEANMLKWKEIVGCLGEQESQRWQEIKELYIKNKQAKSDNSLKSLVDVITQLKDIINLGVSKINDGV